METDEWTETIMNSVVNCQTLDVNCFAVKHVSFVAGLLLEKGIRPIVKQNISCVNQFSTV